MFRFFPHSPAVAAGMARHGLETLADLAEYIGEDILDVAEWLSGQHAYPELLEGMACLIGMLDLSVFHVLFVPADDPDYGLCWGELEDLEAFHGTLSPH